MYELYASVTSVLVSISVFVCWMYCVCMHVCVCMCVCVCMHVCVVSGDKCHTFPYSTFYNNTISKANIKWQE